jgi:hypothetical protein
MTLRFRPTTIVRSVLRMVVQSLPKASQSSPSTIVIPVPLMVDRTSSVPWGKSFRAGGVVLVCWGHERPNAVALCLPVYGPSGLGRRKRRFPTLSFTGQSGRTVSGTKIKYGRWVREGDAEEAVRAIGRCSDECALVKRDDRTSTICRRRSKDWGSRDPD